MQPRRFGWILAGIGITLLIVAIGLFPTECLISQKVAAADSVQGEELRLDPDPVTTCETPLGPEWSSQPTGIAVAVVTGLAGLALAFAALVVAGRESTRPLPEDASRRVAHPTNTRP